MNDQHALAISERIYLRHMPYTTMLDPICVSPDDDTIQTFTRAGDSAIWTGHYLAAESFRYAVTRSPESLDAVIRALRGIHDLTREGGLLSRCWLPVDSPYLDAIAKEQEGHGVHRARYNDEYEYVWVGNVTRDQLCGAFFGLAVAYDCADDPDLRAEAGFLISRMLDYLLDHNWIITEGRVNSPLEFASHPEQILTFLAIGAHVHPGSYADTYRAYRQRLSWATVAPMWIEARNTRDSYFKFNLAAINFYHLLKYDPNSAYHSAYRVFRNAIENHQNAHFEVIDCAIVGTHTARVGLILSLLDQLADRQIRDAWEGQEGDDLVPVLERTNVDFIWQRNPFTRATGGPGYIELNGIDYILPYWMARYHGIIN